MRNLFFVFLAMLQLPLFAQMSAADANVVLDKALLVLKADLPVRMDYVYDVLDDERESLQGDKGVIYIDSDRYALLMQDMKVWCNGATQWSYMREIDEIYVTDANRTFEKTAVFCRDAMEENAYEIRFCACAGYPSGCRW